MRSIDARIIERHFLGTGGETPHIVLFENMPGFERSELETRFALSPESEPVVVAKLHPAGRLILCSRYVLIETVPGYRKLPYSSIDEVRIDLHQAASSQIHRKYQLCTLIAALATGEKLTLKTEPGKGFWGLYHAFKIQVTRKPRSEAN